MSDNVPVLVSIKYGQSMVVFRGNTVDEVRSHALEFVGDPAFGVTTDGDPKSLGDIFTDLTEVLHKGEVEEGLIQQYSRDNRGGGSGAPRSGAPARPAPVDQSQVTYWVGRDQTNAEGLPYPAGTAGPNCGACGAETKLQWSSPSKKAGPNFGKSWPVWQCPNKQGAGHGEFYKA